MKTPYTGRSSRAVFMSVSTALIAVFTTSCAGGEHPAGVSASSERPAAAAACVPADGHDAGPRFEDHLLGISYVIPNGYKRGVDPGDIATPTSPTDGEAPKTILSVDGERLTSGAEVVIGKLVSKTDPNYGYYFSQESTAGIEMFIKTFSSGVHGPMTVAHKNTWGSPDCPALDALLRSDAAAGSSAPPATDSVVPQWSAIYLAFVGKKDGQRWIVQASDDVKDHPELPATAAAEIVARSIRTL